METVSTRKIQDAGYRQGPADGGPVATPADITGTLLAFLLAGVGSMMVILVLWSLGS